MSISVLDFNGEGQERKKSDPSKDSLGKEKRPRDT